ncbi:MFS transporter [bacterium]|nr:MFS transporter [bacterium]
MFFVGNGISLIGTWMQRLAMSWLVYRLTGSAFWLGVAEFASQFSAFLLMPFAGVILDHSDLRRSLLITQFLGFLQAFLLSVYTFSGNINLYQVLLFSVFLGLINAFDLPGRQTFVVRLIDRREDLANAIALNSTLFNAARLIGPSVAGLAVASIGEAGCFFLNSLSFIPIIMVLFHLNILPEKRAKTSQPFRKDFFDGLRYSYRHGVIGPILIFLALISFIGMSFVVLLPVIAKENLGRGSETFGFLMGASGLGALLGALYLASLKDLKGSMGIIPLSFGLFGFGLIFFAWTPYLWISLGIMAFNGFWMILGWSVSNTIIQSIVDDEKRGRVMSFFLMAFMGMVPLGSLLLGSLSQSFGPNVALTISGGSCFLASIFFRLYQSANLRKS